MYRAGLIMLLAVSATLAACLPAAAQSAVIPGWRLERLPQGITQTSPLDQQGRAVVYYQLYAEPYVGSFGTYFTQRVDRIAGGMTKLHERNGTVTEELPLANGTTRTIWQDVLDATNADGVRAHVMIQGWRVGTSQAQVMLVIFHSELDDSHPMVAAALDNVADLWKLGRGISRDAGTTAQQPVAQPQARPAQAPAAPQASAPAAKPCVPTPVRINYPRAVSRQQCSYLGGQYRCSLVTDYVDNYVTVHTGCP